MAVTGSFLQNTPLAGWLTSGSGFTVIVNVIAVPGQPFAEGVTVIVEMTGAAVLLIPVNEGILPVPLAANPIEGSLFVQLYEVLVTVPVKLIAEVVEALHISWSFGCATSGTGLTVIAKVFAGPLQPLTSGVTVMLDVTGTAVLLMAVKDGIGPFPEAASPVDVLSFVQL